jgi:hypothetical protein
MQPALLFAATCGACVALATETTPPAPRAQFTGAQSCASTSCHGGGIHTESLIYARKDRHAVAAGILAKGTSLRIAEALGIEGDPSRAAQCTVCHSPMEAVPPERLVKDLKADRGVSCEACHGAAEPWLRFHTRPDVTYQQIVAVGLRDLNDLYGRANACVACHLNLDEPLRHAGHPELFFELDAQSVAQPRHYKDERPSLGQRSWLTGQAVALRELSWKLAKQPDDSLVQRWKALVWLLRKTDAGRKELPEGADFAAMQSAADQFARSAARATWTKGAEQAAMKTCIAASAEFENSKLDKTEHRRRAEVLVPAIDRLWTAWKKEGAIESQPVEQGIEAALRIAREGEDFDPPKFAAALREIEKAVGKLTQP